MEWIEAHRNKILRLKEHEIFPGSGEPMPLFEQLKSRIEYVLPTQKLSELQLLGMDLVPHQPQFMLSYYIGADWVDRKQNIAIEVLPKICNIDFQKMLIKCFDHEKSCQDIEDILLIRDADREISIPKTDFQLEPFVIITFLNLVERIVKKGLKSNFISREECLNGRIKGKILTSQYFKRGYALGRKDHIDCRYDEYSVDCKENQILKQALLVIRKMMSDRRNIWSSNIFQNAKEQLQRCLPAFTDVSEVSMTGSLLSVHLGPMFTDYRSAVRMAKLIIERQGVGISQMTDDGYQLVPPFIIDMSLLFERYVLSLLLDVYGEKSIDYQHRFRGNIPDFLKADEHLIMDTKYIPAWEEQNVIENIRQLSGYGRHKGIRKALDITDTGYTCPCLIIYPNKNGIESYKSMSDGLLAEYTNTPVTPIDEYQNFYKVAVKLPTL